MDPRNIIILRFHRLDRRQRRHMNFAEANGQRAADYAKAAGLRGMGKLEGSNHAEDVALGCFWCQMISILLHVSSSHFQIVFFPYLYKSAFCCTCLSHSLSSLSSILESTMVYKYLFIYYTPSSYKSYIFIYDPVHFTSIIVQHHRCFQNHVARTDGQKPTAADVADLADSVALRSASGVVTNVAKCLKIPIIWEHSHHIYCKSL